MKADAHVFGCETEQFLYTYEFNGKRFPRHRPLVPEGEYLAAWEKGARVRFPGDRHLVWFQYLLTTWDVGGIRVDAAAWKGSEKVEALLGSLGTSWGELPVSLDDVDPIQVVTLEPVPGFGSVVRSVRPATPPDVWEATDEIEWHLME